MMSYKMKPLGCDPQHVKGMSEKLIVSHYENNYGGAVKRLNLITERLAGLYIEENLRVVDRIDSDDPKAFTILVVEAA